MTTKEARQWWDPYETSNQRQFAYRPNSAAEILLCPTSTTFIDSHSHAEPFGSTVYNKDFCWKPACKPECIRTGTASGQRRNNPHPSQSFMTWRLPRRTAQSAEHVGYPLECSPSEEKFREALTAQYCSTYRYNFTGMPQGDDHHNDAKRRLTPKYSRHDVAPTTNTEMRDSYRQPKQKPELLQYKTRSDVTCRGIVPAVVQRHIHSRQKRSDMTNRNGIHGERVACEAKSLLPQELQQFCRVSPAEGSHQQKEALKTDLSKDGYPNNRETVTKLPAVINPCCPEWISSWPGPI